MGDPVDRLFEPSMLGWVKLVPQRIRSKNEREDQEIMGRFKKMENIRDDLKRIEKGISRWTEASKQLTVIAKELGNAVETNTEAYNKASWEVDMELNDNSALDNIRMKIGMIENLIKQKEKLKYIRLKGDHAEHRLRQLRKKGEGPSYAEESQKFLHIKKEANKQREEIIKEIKVVVDKYVGQSEHSGVSDLVKPQLQAFKLSQFHLFLGCQKLIQGREDDQNIRELEQHWNAFTSKIAEGIPNQEVGGSFNGTAELFGEKLNESNALDMGFDEEEEKATTVKKQSEKKASPPPGNMEENKFAKLNTYRDSDFDGEELIEEDLKTVVDGKKSFDTDLS
eukprot:snap_masked-scaffold_13-processed-gene-3.35-mRNA-1 protein AED:1.00 eAED:1.00 QI:0/-1/0/0/-1/1/1/0/337